jgi:hypothetical protein
VFVLARVGSCDDGEVVVVVEAAAAANVRRKKERKKQKRIHVAEAAGGERERSAGCSVVFCLEDRQFCWIFMDCLQSSL